ncbi:MAG TPA: hypothetical protein DEP35_16275 [Deltaproteobacteria bacterium]|nr:hypothetical protein [Deltaproteobacteria bacterium]
MCFPISSKTVWRFISSPVSTAWMRRRPERGLWEWTALSVIFVGEALLVFARGPKAVLHGAEAASFHSWRSSRA